MEPSGSGLLLRDMSGSVVPIAAWVWVDVRGFYCYLGLHRCLGLVNHPRPRWCPKAIPPLGQYLSGWSMLPPGAMQTFGLGYCWGPCLDLWSCCGLYLCWCPRPMLWQGVIETKHVKVQGPYWTGPSLHQPQDSYSCPLMMEQESWSCPSGESCSSPSREKMAPPLTTGEHLLWEAH